MNLHGHNVRKIQKLELSLIGAVLVFLLQGCTQSYVEQKPEKAPLASTNWSAVGANDAEMRFSELNQISTQTIDGLGLAWSLDLPDENNLEATPLAVDGVILFPGGMGVVYAVDVVSGEILWTYDPQAGERIPSSRNMGLPVNRGLAYSAGQVFVATRDGRMISINSKTGQKVWSSQFLIEGDTASSTGAPRVCGPNVIIGNSGAESLARGYVTALDKKTGAFRWRFFTVPGNPATDDDETTQMVSSTWSGEWWRYGGGGTAWNALTCDEELGQFLIGTGNGAPYALEMRSKGIQDNLFLSSIVSVDLTTGRYKWHYQFNPGEQWDWKATMDMITTKMTIDGKPRKVVLQAPSNGFFYVIDRQNGKLISADKYAKVNWADHIDLETGRPVELPGIRYQKESFTIYPGMLGSHNWQAMSYNPDNGLSYIPYIQMGTTFSRSEDEQERVRNPVKKGFMAVGVFASPAVDFNDPIDGRGSLIAWNVSEEKIQWRVDHPSLWNGGTMVSRGGLVFQGLEDGTFNAYNADSGDKLWSFDTKLGIMAAPVTFSHLGRQYVSILVGYGGSGGWGPEHVRKAAWRYGAQPRRLLTFSLDGDAQLPETPSKIGLDDVAPIKVEGLKLHQTQLNRGEILYEYSCGYCHGVGGTGLGSAPDLRSSGIAASKEALTLLMKDGLLSSKGMPKFANFSDDEIDAVYQYIRYNAGQEDLSDKKGRGH